MKRCIITYHGCVHIDQQVQQVLVTLPPQVDPNIAHDDSDIKVEGQMLGYSIDAYDDFAAVSNCTVSLQSLITFHYDIA